jgi:hypothetical protein
VAPISRRLLASLIDVTLALLAAIIAIGAYTGAAAMLGSKEARGVRSLSKLTGSKRVRITLRVCAFRRAMKKMYEENQVRPYKACLPALMQLPLGLAIESPALWTPLHQGLPDKLAGTIVISDR